MNETANRGEQNGCGEVGSKEPADAKAENIYREINIPPNVVSECRAHREAGHSTEELLKTSGDLIKGLLATSWDSRE